MGDSKQSQMRKRRLGDARIFIRCLVPPIRFFNLNPITSSPLWEEQPSIYGLKADIATSYRNIRHAPSSCRIGIPNRASSAIHQQSFAASSSLSLSSWGIKTSFSRARVKEQSKLGSALVRPTSTTSFGAFSRGRVFGSVSKSRVLGFKG